MPDRVVRILNRLPSFNAVDKNNFAADNSPMTEDERRYVEDHLNDLRFLWNNRIFYLAISMWILMAIPDYLFSVELLLKILPYRISITLFVTFLFVLNNIVKRTERNHFIISFLGICTSAIAVSIICLSYTEHRNLHYFALLLNICAVTGFILLSFRNSMIIVGTVFLIYLVSVTFFGKIDDRNTFILINAYLFSMTLMLIIMRYVHQNHIVYGLRLQYIQERSLQTHKTDLSMSKAMFHTLVQNAPEGILITSKDGYILDANARFRSLYEIDNADLTDKKVADISGLSDSLLAAEPVLSQDDPRLFETVFKSNEGTAKVIEVTVNTVNIEGEVIVQSFHRDITERKKFYGKLAQAERMDSLGKLACGIAHDFRNVLSTILGLCELVKMDDGKNPAQLKNFLDQKIDVVSHEVMTARNLLNELLGLGKQDARQDFAYFDLIESANRHAAIFRNVLKNVTIRFSTSLSAAPVWGNRGQIEQVFTNLFMNANDAMPSGGNIEISIDLVDKWSDLVDNSYVGQFVFQKYFKIVFSDSGVGISKQDLDRIFEPFFTTKSGSFGTGLGLFVVYHVVKEHGGIISVSSREGEGSKFEVYLPQAQDLISNITADRPYREGGTL